ncbi:MULTISPECIES: fimbria/pilus outer membrane usher protein [unclassified Serratia (in: enterobacteria)]|uniref:fimbria/pilus outer membrane usher protein n=2 Tax=unclassified Serratia (in: enterobacteria) TaxID=2647522 RepID=UPI0009DE3D8A|nr:MULTISPECIES: fimbria/pilus outer membrane usher protein [unclassified Serratia (in: enterobacteria)]
MDCGNKISSIRISPLIVWLTLCSSCLTYAVTTASAIADDDLSTRFNTDFLVNKNGSPLDLSAFERGNPVNSGNYRLDIYINQKSIGIQEITIGKNESNETYYCFKMANIESLGIDFDKLPNKHHYAQSEQECVDIKKWVPDSNIDFEQSNLKLKVSIPQAYMQQFDNNYVTPSKADAGVTAAFIDYNANAWRALMQGNAQTQYYAGFNTGLNLAHWRLRHNGYYNQSTGSIETQRKYTSISSYLQRDIAALKAQLTLGQYYTAPDLFDSVSYSGIQLASDKRMLPDSQRGFAPTIRGTAESNAKITVRQGGNILYETSVAPGPFVIDKLYGSGYDGDMEVTVTEADGRQRTFVIPFATVPQLLRPSIARFNAVLGKYRDDRLNKTPEFFQGTYQRGISNLLTAYSGAIVSQDYQAMQVGLALSTTLGAFAVDATQSNAAIPLSINESAQQARGQSYRFTYSKLLETTQTNFTVASYRFSNKNYYSFSDYALAAGRTDNDMPAPSRQRSRVQANVSQNLAEGFGSFYLSGSIQNYWSADQGRDMTYQLGYSNAFGWGGFNLSAGRSRSAYGTSETQYMLNFSLPLGRNTHSAHLSTSLTRSAQGGWNTQTGISGSLGEENLLSYGAYASRNYHNNVNNYGGNAQYRADKAILTGSTSNGSGYSQYGLGASGSLVIHPGGVTLSQVQGETKAVISARGASGAALLNNKGAYIDQRGYAVTAGLTPYRENTVTLDPKDISDRVELKVTEQKTAPQYGAVVMLDYPTVTGYPLLLVLRDEAGNQLPLGAEVFDQQGNGTTFVGQGSRVFLRASESRGRVRVQWGQSADRQCLADYILPSNMAEGKTNMVHLTAICKRQG